MKLFVIHNIIFLLVFKGNLNVISTIQYAKLVKYHVTHNFYIEKNAPVVIYSEKSSNFAGKFQKTRKK